MRSRRLAVSSAVAPLSIAVMILVALSVFGIIAWSVVVAVTLAAAVLGLVTARGLAHRIRASERSDSDWV